MKTTLPILALSTAALLAGCATAPTGPSVMALPGTGKSFEQFRLDDADCRQYASMQIGGAEAANSAAVRNAAVGTAVGALAGAAIGGNRQGAGVGAGAGLIVGSASGAGVSEHSTYAMQRDFDHAYIQCMYAKGEKVPVSEASWRSQTQMPASAPPPPAGSPPPPPPR